MADFETRRTPSGATVVRATGRLTMMVTTELDLQLQSLISAGNNRLVVDLSEAPFLDSAAIGTLIAALKAARHAGGDLRIAAPHDQVMAILTMAKLERTLVAYPNADEAFPEPA
ncbi:MAG: STAS domain-containing protein [Mycobacterium sp.]